MRLREHTRHASLRSMHARSLRTRGQHGSSSCGDTCAGFAL